METIMEKLRRFLGEQGIDAIGLVPMEACRIINPGLLDRSAPYASIAILLAIPYKPAAAEKRNLSLYAVPKDYHLFAKALGEAVCAFLQALCPAGHFAFFCDHSPIDERSAAVLAGIGVRGDHGLIITKKYGSYVFLASILTDVDLDEPRLLLAPEECLHCGACQRACPHHGTCISALTQKKGTLTEEEEALILSCGSVWGCDRCQDACPMNQGVMPSEIPFFKEDRIPYLTKELLEAMDDTAFAHRAYSWRGRNTIARNLDLLASHNIIAEK